MAMTPKPAARLGPLLLVLVIVAVQLLAAWVLDVAAGLRVNLWLAVLVIGLAVALNLGRFVLWGYAHRHYSLSHIYPLTALFFPCILVLSWFRGDHVGAAELAGTVLITIGVIVLSSGGASRKSSHD